MNTWSIYSNIKKNIYVNTLNFKKIDYFSAVVIQALFVRKLISDKIIMFLFILKQ